MKRKLLGLSLGISLLTIASLYSQQTDNWYFGSAAGFPNTGIRIDFSSGTPVVTNTYPIATQEGSSAISDGNGKSLFYTDGNTVWDGSTNTVLSGGTGLKGGSSATQSATIVPMPGNSSKWYIFTGGQDPGTGADGGQNYNIVTSTPGGTFTVSGTFALKAPGTVGEAICIVGSSKPGATYWVITHERNTNNILAFEVNSTTGVVTTPVISNVVGASTLTSWIGTVKSNGCQNKLAFTDYAGGKVELFNFNSTTGSVTGLVASIAAPHAYGIEFSPNDRYLYYSQLDEGILHQYDIVGATNYTQGSWTRGGSGLTAEMGQLQLGPDGKIYVALPGASASAEYIGVINSPNSATAAANFVLNGLYIAPNQNSGFCYRGLPTFPKSLVISNVSINPTSSSFCTGSPTNVSYSFAGAATSQTWTINPGSGWTFTLGTTTSTSPTITFNTPGTYTISSTVFDVCGRTYVDYATYAITNPLTATGTFCTTPGITLNATGSNTALYSKYVWFSSATSTSPIGVGSVLGLNYGDITHMPTSFWVEAASAATSLSSGTSSIGMASSGLTWDANASPYGGAPFTVISSLLTLKSFVVRTRSGFTGNFDVVIKNSSNTTVFLKTYNISASGVDFTVNINTDFTADTYSITLNNSALQWRGGTWAGGTNAGQITLPTFGTNGTYALANLIYDYKNFTYTPACALRTQVLQSCVSPTPIKLLGFTGEFIVDKVYLHLATASETNNDYIEVQRSQDGINFVTIKILKGNGNSSRTSEYSTIDEAPFPRTSYYRLVQHDFNGESSTSKIISVNSPDNGYAMRIYPNPSSESFHVDLRNNLGGELTITDMIGRIVYSKVLDNNVESLELGTNLAKGAYIIKYSSGNGVSSELAIKE